MAEKTPLGLDYFAPKPDASYLRGACIPPLSGPEHDTTTGNSSEAVCEAETYVARPYDPPSTAVFMNEMVEGYCDNDTSCKAQSQPVKREMEETEESEECQWLHPTRQLRKFFLVHDCVDDRCFIFLLAYGWYLSVAELKSPDVWQRAITRRGVLYIIGCVINCMRNSYSLCIVQLIDPCDDCLELWFRAFMFVIVVIATLGWIRFTAFALLGMVSLAGGRISPWDDRDTGLMVVDSVGSIALATLDVTDVVAWATLNVTYYVVDGIIGYHARVVEALVMSLATLQITDEMRYILGDYVRGMEVAKNVVKSLIDLVLYCCILGDEALPPYMMML